MAAMVRAISWAGRTQRTIMASLHSSSVRSGAADQVTHTGQSWSQEDDIRSVRFLNNPKQTNTRWAIDLIAKVPVKMVNKRVVACEGDSNPALGHPKIYINLDTHEPVSCIYCGLRYQLAADHGH